MAKTASNASPALRVSVLLGALVVLSCSATRRHEILTFFFDGVPTVEQARPEDRAEPENPLPEPSATPLLTAEQRAALQAVRVPAASVSTHPPVANRECARCHSHDVETDALGLPVGTPTLREPPLRLCVTCHERFVRPYPHGPAALGGCFLCHLPHRSPNPHLLREPRVATICTRCHQEGTFVTLREHEAVGDSDCHTCHDPHGSDRPRLLRPDVASTLPGVPAR